MLAASVRSGLVESEHDGAVAVVRADGSLVAGSGEIDRPFFLRSAAKPFQAYIAQQAGSKLRPVELSLATSSHRGFPVHVAIIETMLAGVGLGTDHLQCPPAWPLVDSEARRLSSVGHERPRRVWNNCAGKHAGFLRACVDQGWPTETYLDPDHPLQRRIRVFVSELSGYSVEPVGVDGCGAPVLRTTARAMALLFARLADMEELDEVYRVMHTYPSLVSVNGAGDAAIGMALDAAAKGGAKGCIGVALRAGYGLAVKSWDGSMEMSAAGAVSALDALGLLTHSARRALEAIQKPDVLGGDGVVGTVEPRLVLQFT